MSFFVKNVKKKAQKMVNLKRKFAGDGEEKSEPANKKANAFVPKLISDLKGLNKANGNKKKKVEIDDEEIPSDDEIIENGDNDDAYSSVEEDDETAQEKKLRLAKEYLRQMENNQLDNVMDKNELISHQLREDLLEKSGKLKKFVAKNYTGGSVEKELKGHKLSTTCVVVSHDSKYIFSGSKDGSIIKWDVESGKRLFTFKKILPSQQKNKDTHGHSDKVLSLALSSDFKFLASGSVDKNIIVWDPTTCKHVYTFYGHRDAVSGLSFRQNTHELYSCSFDRSVKIWSVDEMTYVETLFGHQDQILAIDSLNKERCVTCGARDRTIRLWKITEESQLIFQGTHFDSIDCIALVNDDYFISGSNDGSVALWHVSKKKPLFKKEKAHNSNEKPSWISAVSALHNTDLFASGSNDGFIRVWSCTEDFFKFQELFKIQVNGFVNDLKFSNDGQYLIAALGQEPKLGRWSKTNDCKNNIAIIKLDKINKVI